MEGDDLNSKSVDREALSVDREVRALIERSELVEKSKSRVVSVVELWELLVLLRDWIVSVVELREWLK